jgi:putative addiction module component (TIGR02574 family)
MPFRKQTKCLERLFHDYFLSSEVGVASIPKRVETMPTDTKEVLETALALPAIDRAAIVESLLASLDQPDAGMDESWAVEAKERLAAVDAGQMKVIPANEVFKQLGNL